MGAISDGAPFSNTSFDGIRRYRTTCKVRVDSHRFYDPIFIGEDVRSIQTAKNIKGPGQANLQLVASKNYLNLLAPNDLINIYFNIGDGEGWTRTFFGFIDRIEETYIVNKDGTPATAYSVLCTDFYKAVDKTQIYFNPHLTGRSDVVDNHLGDLNVGGLALMTSGVRVHGSPPDIIINFLILMFGFATQFSLPPSYNPSLAEKFRQQQTQFIANRLTFSDFARDVFDSGGFHELLNRLRSDVSGVAGLIANSGSTPEERIVALARALDVEPAKLGPAGASAAAGDQEEIESFLFNHSVQEELNLKGSAFNNATEILSVIGSVTNVEHPSLLDVVDVISYVEREAMDGYHDGASIWQRQGPISSFLQSLSNEMVNELFFDLRPVTEHYQEGEIGNVLAPIPYSREEDELAGNMDETGGDQNGIKHIPAMVMREYPFSTISSLALGADEILGGRAQADDPSGLHYLWFGEIFQDEPNRPGRHVVKIPNINLEDKRDDESRVQGAKHLDVAVISEEEIIKTQLGRSDDDHFNLMEFYSDDVLGTELRFYMRDLLPLITPIHIMTNGLRVRSITTRFARFSISVATGGRVQPTEEEIEEVEEAEEAAETPEEPAVVSPNVQASERFLEFEEGQLTREREGNLLVPYVPGGPENPHPNSGVTIGIGYDAGPRIEEELTEDFTAIGADPLFIAFIEAAAGFRGRKAQLYIDTTDPLQEITEEQSEALFLRMRESFLTVVETRLKGSGVSDAVNATEPITDDQWTALHPYVKEFLIDIAWGGNTFAHGKQDLLADIVRKDPNDIISMLQELKEFTRSLSTNLQSRRGRFLRIDWLNARILDVAADLAEASEIAEEAIVQRAREEARANTPVVSSTGSGLDNTFTRRQITRWALLNDHWYQHNLEYLSGKIEMRGAPEIRVGYRLDLYERDMSFYVETVNHGWQFPNKMSTALGVTRGQPSNPYPVYVLPPIEVYSPTSTQRKTRHSRLAHYFVIPDPIAVRRGVVLNRTEASNTVHHEHPISREDSLNYTDAAERLPHYNEAVIRSGSGWDSGLSRNQLEDDIAQGNTVVDDRDNLSGITNNPTDSALPELPTTGEA